MDCRYLFNKSKTHNYFSLLLVIFLCIVSLGCDANDPPRKKEVFKNSKPNVKYSIYEKDGKKYASYDFGKAIFTVDRSELNHFDESTVETYWFWPGLIPYAHASSSGANMKSYSVVRANADFSDVNHYKDGNDSMEYWQKHNCQSKVGQNNKKYWCYQEIDSDLSGFKKYGTQLDKTGKVYLSTTYVAYPDGVKSPHERPLVIDCMDKAYLPTNHQPKDLDCGTTFQYYQQVSIRILFRGDVLPQWQELTSQIDTFFKTRMQEK